MRVILHGEEDLEFRDFGTPSLDIQPEDPEAHYSAMQMFATSLALCTYSILASYGEQIDVPEENMVIRVRWGYAGDPMRIAGIDMDIQWPELPESRLKAAQRAASHCTIHNTLAHPPSVDTRVNT